MTLIEQHARKLVVGVIGGTVLCLGAVLLVTPLPLGWFLVPLGLLILATEFVWARRLLKRIEANVGPARGGLCWGRYWVSRVMGNGRGPEAQRAELE